MNTILNKKVKHIQLGHIEYKKADNSDIQARIEGNKIYIDSVVEKIDRKFDQLINILGADHAGYIKRISSKGSLGKLISLFFLPLSVKYSDQTPIF